MTIPDTNTVQASEFQASRVSMIAFAHFVHDLYTSFLAPLLPLIIEKLSLTLSQAGLLSTVMQIPSLANPFIGLFADNKGLARWLVILAPTLTAIPMSVIGIVPSYGMLLVLFFVAGISVSLFHVPAPVAVARYSGRFKGRRITSYNVCYTKLLRSFPFSADFSVAAVGALFSALPASAGFYRRNLL